MQKHSKVSLLFPLAAAVALASPAAFAQSQGVNAEAQAATQSATPQQKATPAVPATPATPAVPASQSEDGKATAAEPATPATPASPAANTDGKQDKKDWSALDSDGNGSLSVAEAASLDSLAKVFAQADVDGNGELTGEEYKTWWTANAGAKGSSKH